MGRARGKRAGPAQFVLALKRPNKTLRDSRRQSTGRAIFDGNRGWKVRSAQGKPSLTPYTPEEDKFARRAGHRRAADRLRGQGHYRGDGGH
jgi:hypothetical protein